MTTPTTTPKETIPFNTIMMESAVKIVGPNLTATGLATGSGFIIGKAVAAPDAAGMQSFNYVLVTAHHVLTDIKGDDATLILHRLNAGNKWERIEHKIKIRDSGKDLWLKHADVDLAVMKAPLPPGTIRDIIAETLLIDDSAIKEFEIGPGSPVMCLGFPLGMEANAYGFAILRSARIASYPLLPTTDTKTFLLDFNVFGGNSGGPVFFYETNPVYGGATHIGSIQGVIGVMSQQQLFTQTSQSLYEVKQTNTPLALGVAVHASYIKQLLQLLP